MTAPAKRLPAKPRGRPPRDVPREHQVKMRLTTAERRACERAARSEGKSLSDWARNTVLLRAAAHGL